METLEQKTEQKKMSDFEKTIYNLRKKLEEDSGNMAKKAKEQEKPSSRIYDLTVKNISSNVNSGKYELDRSRLVYIIMEDQFENKQNYTQKIEPKGLADMIQTSYTNVIANIDQHTKTIYDEKAKTTTYKQGIMYGTFCKDYLIKGIEKNEPLKNAALSAFQAVFSYLETEKGEHNTYILLPFKFKESK